MRRIWTILMLVMVNDIALAQGLPPSDSGYSQIIRAVLPSPFGSIISLKVEIVDGDQLQRKAYTDRYLLKVITFNNQALPEPVLMCFSDETGSLPNDDEQLYYLLKKKKRTNLSDRDMAPLKKKYVGKSFEVRAYETGGFTGFPNGYFNYRPLEAGSPLHFESWLIVIAIVDGLREK